MIKVKAHRRGKSIVKAYIKQQRRYLSASTSKEKELAFRAYKSAADRIKFKHSKGIDLLGVSPLRNHGGIMTIVGRISRRNNR